MINFSIQQLIAGLKDKLENAHSLLPDQCKNYKRLTTAKRRFDAPDAVDTAKCDQFGKSNSQEDWQGDGFYKIEGDAGTKLSENCSGYKYGNCGTHLGGHLIGGHPELIGQTVVRNVKFEGCVYNNSIAIEVTNCGTFFVYHLKEVSRCALGYCTE